MPPISSTILIGDLNNSYAVVAYVKHTEKILLQLEIEIEPS